MARPAWRRRWPPSGRPPAALRPPSGRPLAALWPAVPAQRCTVHEHRNLLARAPERLHEEFKRRIRTQTVLPSAETAAMLFRALLASGQISMRKVDGWQSLGQPPAKSMIDLAA